MDRPFIASLVALFEASSLAELEFRTGEASIRLARHAAPAVQAVAPAPVASHAPVAVPAAKPDGHLVGAPCIGVFYRRPSPEAPPFVEVGDTVREGQPLGLIEAMKVLNAIEADRDGIVAEILEEDAASVEAGAPLFRITPA